MYDASGPLVPTYENCFVHDPQDALLLVQAVINKTLPAVDRRPQDQERAALIKSGNVFIFDEKKGHIQRWTDGVSWSPSRIHGEFLLYREKNLGPRGAAVANHSKHRSSHHLSSGSGNITRPNSNIGRIPYSSSSRHRPSSSGSRIHGVSINSNNRQYPLSHDHNVPYGSAASPPGDRGMYSDYNLYGSLTSNEQYKEGGLMKKTISVPFGGSSYRLISYYIPENVKAMNFLTPTQDPKFAHISIQPELAQTKNVKISITVNQRDFMSQTTYGGGYLPAHQMNAYPYAPTEMMQHPYTSMPQDSMNYPQSAMPPAYQDMTSSLVNSMPPYVGGYSYGSGGYPAGIGQAEVNNFSEGVQSSTVTVTSPTALYAHSLQYPQSYRRDHWNSRNDMSNGYPRSSTLSGGVQPSDGTNAASYHAVQAGYDMVDSFPSGTTHGSNVDSLGPLRGGGVGERNYTSAISTKPVSKSETHRRSRVISQVGDQEDILNVVSPDESSPLDGAVSSNNARGISASVIAPSDSDDFEHYYPEHDQSATHDFDCSVKPKVPHPLATPQLPGTQDEPSSAQQPQQRQQRFYMQAVPSASPYSIGLNGRRL